jgi:Oxygenase domain of the 2OGFeDO superfamily
MINSRTLGDVENAVWIWVLETQDNIVENTSVIMLERIKNSIKKTISFNKMVKRIVVKKHFTDEEMKAKEGTFFDESSCKIYKENIDVYTETGELLLKLRKNVLTNAECETLFHHKKAAKGGMRPNASGSPKNKSKYIEVISKSTGKSVRMLRNIKKVKSGILGYFDNFSMFGSKHKSPGSNAKCRMTAYTGREVEKFEKSLPTFQKVSKLFKKLVPDKYKIQKKAIKTLNKKFVIKDTVFTTVTVNSNFRTALHQDAGDLRESMGNLLVVTDSDDYSGAYTMFPQYKVGFDAKNGDIAFMNVHEFHCNSEMINPNKCTRLSFVFYLREKMLKGCPK